jgi:hypothetical protein
MTKIRLSPEIPDYFIRMDWREQAADPAGFSDKLSRHYESGDVIIVERAPIKVDFDLVNRITLPPGRQFQKTSDAFFLYPNLLSPAVARTFYSAFGLDFGLYLAFRSEVARVSADLRMFARAAFATYRFAQMGLNWRFTETDLEDLHIDGYGVDDDLQFIRIFMNLDTRPRCWNTSYRLDELVTKHYSDARMREVQGTSADAFNKRLNLHVFGGKDRIGRDGLPRHVVEFDTGDVWLCDSRLVSHQIVWGRRLVATHFRVHPASMRDPSLSLENRVRSYHRRYALTESTGAARQFAKT